MGRANYMKNNAIYYRYCCQIQNLTKMKKDREFIGSQIFDAHAFYAIIENPDFRFMFTLSEEYDHIVISNIVDRKIKLTIIQLNQNNYNKYHLCIYSISENRIKNILDSIFNVI